MEADRAKACVTKAFDLGINFIDTANVYAGRGAAETLLGEALAGQPRTSYVLATKLMGPMSDTDRGLSRAQVIQTDRCIVETFYEYRLRRPLSMPSLRSRYAARRDDARRSARCVRQGKVRYIGFSEWSPAQISASFALTGVGAVFSSQPQYWLLWRRPEEKVMPLCATNGVSQIVWSPLAQGVSQVNILLASCWKSRARPAIRWDNGCQSLLRPDILRVRSALETASSQCRLHACAILPLRVGVREPNVASAAWWRPGVPNNLKKTQALPVNGRSKSVQTGRRHHRCSSRD